ncbi:hypothetical protein RB628_29225 [Streptomyces sp. ADMS]|nr:hypothetical protein [Streptomyces sp. ADMS]MDW4909313.1 hypothetical protein [Streptomyces sp. ADMS]
MASGTTGTTGTTGASRPPHRGDRPGAAVQQANTDRVAGST